jgi:allantoin racemase
MKICVIAPVVVSGEQPMSAGTYLRVARSDCEVEVVSLDKGPASIESEYEEAIATPHVIAQAQRAQERRADAIVVSCMLDPGIDAAREVLTIPVVGPAHASMHLAALLGDRFTIVTVLDRLASPLQRLSRRYGLSEHLASVRAIDVPVLDLRSQPMQVVDALVLESMQALDNDGADVIVFGCTGMAGMSNSVREGLNRRGYDVPVIDPSITALKMAEALVDMGLSHSKMTYPSPPQKTIVA